MNITKPITPRTINGHKYTGHYIPALEAHPTALKIAAVLGGERRRLLGIDNSIKSDIEDVDYLYGGEESLVLRVLSYTLRDGDLIDRNSIDRMYTGNLVELDDAFKFAIEVNFGDFLRGLGFTFERKEKRKPRKKTTEL